MSKATDTVAKLAEALRPVMDYEDAGSSDEMSIGRLATHLRVSLRTLRFYEQSGLLQPERDGVRRLYSVHDRQRLEVIVALRAFEVSLTGIKSLMTVVDGGGPNIEERIRTHFDQLLEEVLGANRERIVELETIDARIGRLRMAIAS